MLLLLRFSTRSLAHDSLKSNRTLFIQPFPSTINPARTSILRSFPIQRFVYRISYTPGLSQKKKERKCKRIVIAHARERKVSYIESNFENLKFKIEDFGLWIFFFFFLKMEKQRREYSKIILSNVSKILPNIITLSTKMFQVVFKNRVLFYH